MKTIVAFGASSSLASINAQLAHYTAHHLQRKQPQDVELFFLDLNDFEMPIYSIDREEHTGIPDAAYAYKKHISEADGVVVSFAEHNGSYTASFKNIMDRCSRIEGDFWCNKPIFALSTSPGARGGRSVLETAVARIPRMGGRVVAQFSLPLFEQYFDIQQGIQDSELLAEREKQAKMFSDVLLG